ncbi:hypothetical protein FB451DRAFT_1227908 [Mycena latifolia]|nr:hypothetical protein FB451DRAFT_1227908 [Mycena latifolia]
MHTVLPKIAKHLPSSISTLVLSVHYHPPVQGMPCPPLRAITCLEIGTQQTSLTISEVITCLASFPVLEEAKIWLRDSSPWGGNDMRLPPTTLGAPESLRSLEIRCRAGIEPVLAWIQTTGPAISTLALVFARHPQTRESIHYALQYIDSLGPSLTSLSLTIEDFNVTHDFYPEFPTDFLTRNTRLQALVLRASPMQVISILRKTYFPPGLNSVTIWVPARFLSENWLNDVDLSTPWDALDSLIAPRSTVNRLHIVYFGNAIAI